MKKTCVKVCVWFRPVLVLDPNEKKKGRSPLTGGVKCRVDGRMCNTRCCRIPIYYLVVVIKVLWQSSLSDDWKEKPGKNARHRSIMWSKNEMSLFSYHCTILMYKISSSPSLRWNQRTLELDSEALPRGYWVFEKMFQRNVEKNTINVSENGQNEIQ